VTWSFLFFGVSMVLFGVVRATGAVMAPLFILTLSLLVVRFPVAEALLDKYQADAIWWSFPISSALSAVLAALYYRYEGWRTTRMVTPVEAPVERPAEGSVDDTSAPSTGGS
jgi:Na+-driven multidrug efflux pump